MNAIKLANNSSVTPVQPLIGDLPPSPPRSSSEDPSGEVATPLAVYLRDLDHAELMTREEETALATAIAGLRCALWRAALSYPPFIAGLCGLAREVLPTGCPAAALDAMIVAARNQRDRDILIHREQYEGARMVLAGALAEADLDGRLADRLLADLISIEGGEQRGLGLRVKLPPRGSLPFLTYVQEVRRTYQALWAARTRFVQANLRLVVLIARRYSHGRVALQDLIQEGNLGLMKAVNRFDPTRGCRFSTYGTWWIRHAVTRALADRGRTVRLPVHMIDAYNKVGRARRRFEALHGREADEAELSRASGVSPERLARMSGALTEPPISLSQRVSADADLTLLDAMEDHTPLAPEVMDHGLRLESLRELFESLSPMEVDILRKRMGMDGCAEMTLKEIGRHYNLSRERIRQLQEQALARLRTAFDQRGLL